MYPARTQLHNTKTHLRDVTTFDSASARNERNPITHPYVSTVHIQKNHPFSREFNVLFLQIRRNQAANTHLTKYLFLDGESFFFITLFLSLQCIAAALIVSQLFPVFRLLFTNILYIFLTALEMLTNETKLSSHTNVFGNVLEV